MKEYLLISLLRLANDFLNVIFPAIIRHDAVHLFIYEWRRNIGKTLKKYWKKILMLLKLMGCIPLIQKVKILISLVYTERKSSW